LIALLVLTSLPAPAIPGPGSPRDPSSKASSRRPRPGPSTPTSSPRRRGPSSNPASPLHPATPGSHHRRRLMPPNPRTPSHPRAAPQPRATTADRSPRPRRRALPEPRTSSYHPPSSPPHHRVPPPHSHSNHWSYSLYQRITGRLHTPSLGHVTMPRAAAPTDIAVGPEVAKDVLDLGSAPGGYPTPAPADMRPPGSAPALEGRPAPARPGAGAWPPGGPARGHPAAAPPPARRPRRDAHLALQRAELRELDQQLPAAPQADPNQPSRSAWLPSPRHRPRLRNTPPCPHAATAITCRTHFTNEPKVECASPSPGYLTTPSAARASLPPPSLPALLAMQSTHARRAPPPLPAPAIPTADSPHHPNQPRAAPRPRATTAARSPRSRRRALPEPRTSSYHPRGRHPRHTASRPALTQARQSLSYPLYQRITARRRTPLARRPRDAQGGRPCVAPLAIPAQPCVPGHQRTHEGHRLSLPTPLRSLLPHPCRMCPHCQQRMH